MGHTFKEGQRAYIDHPELGRCEGTLRLAAPWETGPGHTKWLLQLSEDCLTLIKGCPELWIDDESWIHSL